MNQFTAAVTQVDGWWIGWIEQIPGVNCQERTKDELLGSLKVTLQEALEDLPQEDLANLSIGYERESIYLSSGEPSTGICPSTVANCCERDARTLG